MAVMMGGAILGAWVMLLILSGERRSRVIDLNEKAARAAEEAAEEAAAAERASKRA